MRILSTLLVVLLIGLSCKRNNDWGTECPLVDYVPVQLKFFITDKTTHEDLFFGTNPPYSFSDLVAYRMKNATDTVHIPLYFTAIVPYRIMMFAPYVDTKYFLQIKNQTPDTLDLDFTARTEGCCPSGSVFTSLKLNGATICTNCDFTVPINVQR